MRHRFQHFLKIFVYSDPKFANKARIPKKNSKFNPFVIKADLETNCKSFRKKQQEKISIQKKEHSQKKIVPTTEATISMNTKKWKKSCIQFQ